MISTLAGAIIGSGITVVTTVLNNRHLTKQEEKKRQRALLDELCGSCFKIQKLCRAALEGVYPISEFSFEPLIDIKDRIMAIIIMDFEEKMSDAMNEYFGYLTKFENTIEEFHALYVANPSLEDPLIKSKREENMKIYIDLLNNSVIFLKKIKKAYQKL